MHVVERLAGFSEAYRGRPIAPDVLHHAKRAVIDWYAALLPGAVVAPAVLLERALAGELDLGDSHLALGRRATVRAAALINGAAAHTVEVDDIFREGIYHPGAPTIAAALAVAQSRRASGEQFGTTPAPSAASARRAPRRSCSASTESALPMRSPR